MLLVYTGEGKGKTSACLGQCVRALGHGLRVCFVQFLKQDAVAGEQRFLSSHPGIRWYAGGKGFYFHNKREGEHRAAALDTLAFARHALQEDTPCNLLVLDVSLYALHAGLLAREEVQEVIDAARQRGVHLVLSGRDAPQWLVDQADTVTAMHMVKHPHERGEAAVMGIDF